MPSDRAIERPRRAGELQEMDDRVIAMSKLTRPSIWRYPFWVTFLGAIALYLLRGFGIITSWPGGIILGAVGLAIALGIGYGIDKTRRF